MARKCRTVEVSPVSVASARPRAASGPWQRGRDLRRKASRRVPECRPSAPTTRSARRDAPLREVTSTPPSCWSRPVITSSKTYSMSFRVASRSSSVRSPRGSSTTRTPCSPRRVAGSGAAIVAPRSETRVSRRVPVRAASTASSSPMRSTTSTATPRRSIGYPPPRTTSARSTTVTSTPARRSQNARTGPPTPAPETAPRVRCGWASARGALRAGGRGTAAPSVRSVRLRWRAGGSLRNR